MGQRKELYNRDGLSLEYDSSTNTYFFKFGDEELPIDAKTYQKISDAKGFELMTELRKYNNMLPTILAGRKIFSNKLENMFSAVKRTLKK